MCRLPRRCVSSPSSSYSAASSSAVHSATFLPQLRLPRLQGIHLLTTLSLLTPAANNCPALLPQAPAFIAPYLHRTRYKEMSDLISDGSGKA